MSLASIPHRPLAPVATVLLPSERSRIDAAGEGIYRTFHRETVDDVLGDLRTHAVSAVLLSVVRCGVDELTHVARLIREFPRVPTVAILSTIERTTPQVVLSLGQSGVSRLIDIRHPTGWRELRDVLIGDHHGGIERLALAQLSLDLAGAPGDCWRFFEALFQASPRVTTVRALAVTLQVLPSTLMSRFFRARLPAPKRYLILARLTKVAQIFENPGLSIANVANHMEYSSPQSFGRHIRATMNMTALEFRQHYDGEGMLHRFREELIVPFVPVLRGFSPLTGIPCWIAR